MIQATKPTRRWALTLAENSVAEYPVLRKKIGTSCEVSAEEAIPLLAEVYIFLGLITYTDQKLTPSLLVDDAWHELILCTKHYHQVCEKEFGRFIHHHPGGMKEENKEQFVNTWKFYLQEVGNPPTQFWGEVPYQEATSADCGSCSSL